MADELDIREDRELESIKQQMEQTRANLGDKLEKLEAHVTGTVSAATETVADAVQSVKDVVGTVTDSVATVASTVTETASSVSETVSGTVASVAEAFNVSKQIEAHPWGAMGAAVGLGFLGSLLLGSSKPKETPSTAPTWSGFAPAQSQPTPNPEPSVPAEPSAVGQLINQVTEGYTEMALNAILGTVRQLTASLPEQFRDPANQFVDNMAKDFGVSSKVIASNPPVTPQPQNSSANGSNGVRKEEKPRSRARNRLTA